MEKDIFIRPEKAFAEIERAWKAWDAEVKPGVYVVGVSGGVDSTCVVALAARIFGKDRVVGVSLPCDGQKDMWAADMVFETLGIRRVDIDICEMFDEIKYKLENNCIEMSEQARINTPARLRMTVLFGVAQCLGGVVVNTCNRSESVCGYDTLFGDSCGCYAPVKNLVKTEVMDLASWLGMPEQLARKVPVDGLQPLTDEEKFGFSYAELDAFIRDVRAVEDGLTKAETAEKIKKMYRANKFKLEIINVPGPAFAFAPDVFRAGVFG